MYLIPASIIIASVLSVLLLDKMYPKVSGSSVTVRVLPTSDTVAFSPESAFEELREQTASPSVSSGRQAWLLADIPAQPDFSEHLLELPSRYVTRLTCWDAATMSVIGAASRRTSAPDIRMAKLGFNVTLGQLPRAQQILCHGTFTQSHPVSARVWRVSDFQQASSRFDHGMGLLEGGLLTPAVFALLIGLISRQSTYTVLAAWLIANLRLGAFAMGWDTQWLGYLLPLEAMPFIRQLTAGAYYLLTVNLLIRLLRANSYTEHPRLLKLTKASALLLMLASALPSFWFWSNAAIIAIFGMVAAVFLLTRVIKQTGLTIWFWQVTSLVLAFSIIIGLAVLQIFGDINDLGGFYTTALLLISSAAMILSLAERVRNARIQQHRLRTELVTSYAITPIGMFTLDAQQRFIRMNPILERMLGFTVAQHPNTLWTDYFPKLDWDELTRKAHAYEDVEVTAKKHHSNDTPKHFAIRAMVVDKTIEGSLQDISAHTEVIEQLRILAGKDPVTEALNQRSFEESVVNAITTLETTGPSSLAFLNVGHFKNINSLFGYRTGDALLIQTRKKITAFLTQPHELGRVGSDEFAILFPGQTAEQIEPVVEALARNINNNLFSIDAHTINVSVTVGLIDLSPEFKTAKEALFTAGIACRDAHKDQRTVVAYKRGSTALSAQRELLHLFDQIEDGQPPEGFRLHLQPIFCNHAPANIMSFEVLLRVNDSHDRPLSTGRVITAAEDIGTITTIDKWALETILSWLDQHQQHLPTLHLLSFNISGVSLNSDAFTEDLFRLLDRYKHLTRYLLIEMTEGVALQNLDRTQKIIRRIQEQGARVGLDDFGAGYTSFAYLRSLKADVIKIDGSLIQNMLADADSIAIVQTIVQLVHQLKMTCIAEWVEDRATFEALQDMGIDYVQGFFISPAIPLETVLESTSITDFLSTNESRDSVNRIFEKQQGLPKP